MKGMENFKFGKKKILKKESSLAFVILINSNFLNFAPFPICVADYIGFQTMNTYNVKKI